MTRVAIAGGAGYTAGELIRILINHPQVELRYIQSNSHRGEKLSSVHGDLLYLPMSFNDIDFNDIDVLFLCMGHGASAAFLEANPVPADVKIIDLSNDFRLHADAGDFIYGLPELSHEQISSSLHVANPGCFATCIELGMLPMAAAGLLPEEVSVFGITGSTGAGQKPSASTHFSERTANLSNYKIFTHQHLDEIGETLVGAGAPDSFDVAFAPVRGCHSRGIFVNTIIRTDQKLDRLKEIYRQYYEPHPFVWVSDEPIYMKQVVNTNNCFVHLAKEGNKLLITSTIDNLIKGASGQAVQNMNIMCGFDQTAGLRLKANYF